MSASTFTGTTGNDSTVLGLFNDSLFGDLGNDTLGGGGGNNTFSGGGGNDSLLGGGGNESLDGGDGNNTIDAGGGADTIVTTTGNNSLYGGEGADSIIVTSGNNTYDGGAGNDTIQSGGGADSIIGGYGNDSIFAGGDRDTISWAPGQGSDTINGGVPQGNPAQGDRVNLNLPGFDTALGDQGMPTLTSGPVNGFTLLSGDGGVSQSTNRFRYDATGEILELTAIEGFYVCYYPGTMIATPDGERAVETLAIGDLVLTSEGKVKPVRWMGRQTVSTRFGDPLRMLPVRILAGALADGVPTRDLLVSPDHAMLVEGVLVQAAALVNGITILRQFDVPEVFTYHHIELAEHDLVLAEGAPAETFVDNIDRLNFDNWAEHEALYGNEPSIPEMDRPRAKAQRQVPRFVQLALHARAGLKKTA